MVKGTQSALLTGPGLSFASSQITSPTAKSSEGPIYFVPLKFKIHSDYLNNYTSQFPT